MTAPRAEGQSSHERPNLIGPGRLVLVVGPSGAGKDTLLDYARSVAGDSRLVFPRRVVTRKGDASEDHDSMSEADFERAARNGIFSIWWEAHGHRYGLPLSIEDDIRAGRAVFCNVSRSVVPAMRARFEDVCVVLVTAPEEMLRVRLAARSRDTDGDLAQRMRRKPLPEAELKPDLVIENTGPIAAAGDMLVRLGRLTG